MPRADSFVASVGVSIPLYAGGAMSARVAALQAEKAANDQKYSLQLLAVKSETHMAYRSMESSLSRIHASRQALLSAERAREATERAYRLGVRTATQVLDSIQEEFRTRRNLLQAQYRFINSRLALLRWSGQLSDTDIQQVNGWLASP